MKSFVLVSFFIPTIISCSEFIPAEPLPSIFSSERNCIATYGQCMQDLAICWRNNRFLDISICDTFQDKCELIYSKCRYVEIPIHSLPYQQTQTEQCMADYDDCLSHQTECHHNFKRTTDIMYKNFTDCSKIPDTCRFILYSCRNPGAVEMPRPTGTALSNYLATWTAPETSLPATPTMLLAASNPHCLETYHNCAAFHETCLNKVKSYQLEGNFFDAEHRAKACYQILLRCKSDVPLCLSYSSPMDPVATWLPDDIAQGVEIPPWVPNIDKTDGNYQCLAGYQRCLIYFRNCLLVARMLQDAGWFEKAEIHRKKCQDKFVPLCMNGVSICEGLR